MSSWTESTSQFAATLKAHSNVVPLDPKQRANRLDRIEEARVLLGIATDYRENGWPTNASRFARRALGLLERELGTDHPCLARVLLCVAGAREELADHARAEADYRRASTILGRLDDDPPDREGHRLRLQVLRELAGVIRALGRDRQAEAMLKQALGLAERTFGWKDAEVASSLNALGVHYRSTGEYGKASRLHRRALAIMEEALGPEHPQVAAVLHQMGLLERARGQYAAGEPYARRSAEIREKTLGPDHTRVAAGYTAIAALLDGQGKYDEAESMYRRAHVILERRFGPDHQEVALVAAHLARTSQRALHRTEPKSA
jgi:tetratricopeptide (TPR) repeat protein